MPLLDVCMCIVNASVLSSRINTDDVIQMLTAIKRQNENETIRYKKKTFHSLMHCCSIVMTVEQHFTPNCHDCNLITNIFTFFSFFDSLLYYYFFTVILLFCVKF